MIMYYTLNRIEENAVAVFTDDNGKIYNKSISLLPDNAKTGDVFTFLSGKPIFDKAETMLRREKATEKKNKLFNKLKNQQGG